MADKVEETGTRKGVPNKVNPYVSQTTWQDFCSSSNRRGMEVITYAGVGHRLAAAREKAGFTQAEACQKLNKQAPFNTTVKRLGAIETGKVSPGCDELMELGRLYGVHPAHILGIMINELYDVVTAFEAGSEQQQANVRNMVGTFIAGKLPAQKTYLEADKAAALQTVQDALQVHQRKYGS